MNTARVTPTTQFNNETKNDEMIWLVQTPKRNYCVRRVQVKGLVALTVTGPWSFSEEDGLMVCGAKIPYVKEKRLITKADGFSVPRSWYGNPGMTHRDLTPKKPEVLPPFGTAPQTNTPAKPVEEFPQLTTAPVKAYTGRSWASVLSN